MTKIKCEIFDNFLGNILNNFNKDTDLKADPVLKAAIENIQANQHLQIQTENA